MRIDLLQMICHVEILCQLVDLEVAGLVCEADVVDKHFEEVNGAVEVMTASVCVKAKYWGFNKTAHHSRDHQRAQIGILKHERANSGRILDIRAQV